MKKLSTILLAVAFIASASASFAATDFLKDYQTKRDAAIKKQDEKLSEIQKKQEEAKKQQEANKAALEKKQAEYKKQQEANKAAMQKRQQERKDAINTLKNSFKY